MSLSTWRFWKKRKSFFCIFSYPSSVWQKPIWHFSPPVCLGTSVTSDVSLVEKFQSQLKSLNYFALILKHCSVQPNARLECWCLKLDKRKLSFFVVEEEPLSMRRMIRGFNTHCQLDKVTYWALADSWKEDLLLKRDVSNLTSPVSPQPISNQSKRITSFWWSDLAPIEKHICFRRQSDTRKWYKRTNLG